MSVALVALLGGPAVAQETTSLEGHWRLNASMSDAGGGLASDDAFGRPRGGRAPVGGGFGGPGGSPLGGVRGRSADPVAMKQRRDLMRELLEAPVRFTLQQDADAVHFTFPDGRLVGYQTNGKTEKHQAINGTIETKTRWQRGALIRETAFDDGTRLIETFTLEESGHLVVTVKINGGLRSPRPIRRVYDRESPADRQGDQD